MRHLLATAILSLFCTTAAAQATNSSHDQATYNVSRKICLTDPPAAKDRPQSMYLPNIEVGKQGDISRWQFRVNRSLSESQALLTFGRGEQFVLLFKGHNLFYGQQVYICGPVKIGKATLAGRPVRTITLLPAPKQPSDIDKFRKDPWSCKAGRTEVVNGVYIIPVKREYFDGERLHPEVQGWFATQFPGYELEFVSK
jgi:hypothetical protein